MVDEDGDDSFKRPGSVPFNWEIRPGIPKTRKLQPIDPTLLQPPKKLPPLRLNQPPPPPSPPSSKTRPASPFDPPPSFKLKPPPDLDSHSSGPPAPYFKSSSPGRDPARRWRFVKSLFGMKKSKSGDLKSTEEEEEESTSSRSDWFYDSETMTTFSPSEEGSTSRGSVSTRWSSPKSSSSLSSSFGGGSPLKRIQSDLSSYEKQTILMMAHHRFG
ncbi:unnamed protein product [Cochlearia groenlandica]